MAAAARVGEMEAAAKAVVAKVEETVAVMEEALAEARAEVKAAEMVAGKAEEREVGTVEGGWRRWDRWRRGGGRWRRPRRGRRWR